MKKSLLFSACLALAFATQAQSTIQLYQADNLWTPGNYVFNDVEIVDEGIYFEVTIDPNLSVVTSAASVDAVITATCLTGQMIQMCAGGECEKNTMVSKFVTLTKNVKLPLKLEYFDEFDSKDEIPQGIKVELSVYDDSVDDGESIYLITMNDPTGAVEIVKSNNGVSMSGKTLHYNLDAASTIAVYDVNGRCVMTAAVNGVGALDLTSLGKGVYAYRVISQQVKSAKKSAVLNGKIML